MDYSRLIQETRKYPGKTDAEIVAALNEPIVRRQKVTTDQIMYEAYNINLYPKVVAIAIDATQPVELRAFAQSLLDIAKNMPDLDTLSPAGETMLNTLVQYQLITEEQAQKFRDMGIISSTSIAKKAGLGVVTVGDIEAAREWQELEEQLQPMRDRLEVAYWQAKQRLESAPVPEWSEIAEMFS